MKAIYDARYQELIAWLKGARNKAGLTQSDVASKTGRCRIWVAKIESCELECGIMELLAFFRCTGFEPGT